MAALPLVTPGADGQLEVGSDAAELLSSLNGPLCVIAFTGMSLCVHKANEVVLAKICKHLPCSLLEQRRQMPLAAATNCITPDEIQSNITMYSTELILQASTEPGKATFSIS